MAPVQDDPNKCSLPFRDDASGEIFYFDVQSAEPGTFTVPGVIELETYEPGVIAEIAWIYFKGDPQAGPRPGHPFDMPFDNRKTMFAIDLVDVDDSSTVIQNVMPATNSTPFWKGGAPFGRPGSHSMVLGRLDSSCEYDGIAQMLYRWIVPEAMKTDVPFRFKLQTTEPSSTFLSGKLQFSSTQAVELSSLPTLYLKNSTWGWLGAAACFASGGALVILLFGAFLVWRKSRLQRRIKI